jgi:hypothetical protein
VLQITFLRKGAKRVTCKERSTYVVEHPTLLAAKKSEQGCAQELFVGELNINLYLKKDTYLFLKTL